jgi:hypothetical protein
MGWLDRGGRIWLIRWERGACYICDTLLCLLCYSCVTLLVLTVAGEKCEDIGARI